MKAIYHFIVDRKIPTLACSLSFMFVLNGGSFLFLYIILSGFFGNSFNELVMNHIQDGQFKDLVLYFFNHQNNLPYSILLIVTSIYSASSLYYHLMNIVELITYTPYEISLSKRFAAILFTIVYLIFFQFGTLVLTELILFFNRFYQILSYFLFLFIWLLTLYFIHSICFKTGKIKRIYKGVLFSFIYTILWTILFFIYLSLFTNFKIVYGILAFFVILIFYIYIICIGILLGIYMNHTNINLKKLLKNNE